MIKLQSNKFGFILLQKNGKLTKKIQQQHTKCANGSQRKAALQMRYNKKNMIEELTLFK